MRKFKIYFLLSILALSCEDVIDVEVPTEEPRLVIDAMIRVDTTQESLLVQIKAQLTSSFFDTITPAQLDLITLHNIESGETITLTEATPNSGVYQRGIPTTFLTTGTVELMINHNENTFMATSAYTPTVPIDHIEQGDTTLFDEEEIEIIISFTDEPNRDDYYLFDFSNNSYLTSEDKFYKGQAFEFSYFYEDTIETNQELTVSILGIDQAFYNYWNLLIDQSGQQDFGPFQTPAATVRGNILNTSSSADPISDFALGYFAICQEYDITLTLSE